MKRHRQRSTHGVGERRYLPAQKVRAVEGQGGKLPKLVGYAAVFDSPSVEMIAFSDELPDDLRRSLGIEKGDCVEFEERISPGAFAASIDGGDIKALKNHDTTLILGRTTSRTLALSEDDTGLAYEVDPPNASYALDLVECVRREDSDGCSFGFDIPDVAGAEEWSEEGGKIVRRLHKIALSEISLGVTFPAYLATTLGIRSLDRLARSIARPTRAVRSLAACERKLRLLDL